MSSISSCVQSTHKNEVFNYGGVNLTETKRFNQSIEWETRQYLDSVKLINALDLISNEKDPSRKLELIMPWIDGYNIPLLAKERQPHIWIRLNLFAAEAHNQLSEQKKSDDLDKAISHYENTIQILQREKYPVLWAAARNNLANALSRLPDEKRIKNLERVIKLTEEALQIRTQDKFPDEWAKTQIIRAKAYHERSLGDKASNLKLAAELFEQALRFQTQRAFPSDFLVTVYELSLVLLELKQYPKALSYIEKALEINERELLQHDILSSEAKHLVSQAHSLFANAVWAHVQLKNYTAAVQIMEQGKSRLLKKKLSLDHLTRPNDPLTSNLFHWLSTLPSDSAIVAPVFSDQGTIVFILKPGITNIDESNVISISGFTRKDLYGLMRGGMSGEWGGYMVSYRDLKIETSEESKRIAWESYVTKIFNIFSTNWFDQTLFHLQQLNIKLGSRLIWIVDSDTNLLPINSINFNGEPLLANYYIQFVPSIYSAFVAQENLKKEKKDHINLVINPTEDLPGTIIESKVIQKHFPSKTELIGSQATIENFEQLIKSTPSTYLHVASHGTHSIVNPNPNNSGLVLKGKRVFSIRNILNLPSNQFDANRLVVLSACETNFVDIEMPFESLGVPAAFLQAGAPAVISTLWLVNDVATMLIMTKFYEFHRKFDIEPVVALAKAQLWLRSATYKEIEKLLDDFWDKKETNEIIRAATMKSTNIKQNDVPFANRYFWAGFVYTGM